MTSVGEAETTRPTEVLERYEAEIRLKITETVSDALHILQRQQQQDDPVYSDDNANYLCAALEAAFLHGLLPSVGQKPSRMTPPHWNDLNKLVPVLVIHVAMYIGSGSGPNVTNSLSFWNLVIRFTHSDVVSQLRHLSQINSEIGLSRAWVRMALNDGLIESYISSVLADKKNLQKYYHKTAYLRDDEQPEILKTYFQGLADFQFKLSCNSRVLNSWSALALSIAGLTDHEAPPPVVKPGSKGFTPRKQSGINAGDSLYTPVEARGVRSRSKGGSSISSDASRSHASSFNEDYPDEELQDHNFLTAVQGRNETLSGMSVAPSVCGLTESQQSEISGDLDGLSPKEYSSVVVDATCNRSESLLPGDIQSHSKTVEVNTYSHNDGANDGRHSYTETLNSISSHLQYENLCNIPHIDKPDPHANKNTYVADCIPKETISINNVPDNLNAEIISQCHENTKNNIQEDSIANSDYNINKNSEILTSENSINNEVLNSSVSHSTEICPIADLKVVTSVNVPDSIHGEIDNTNDCDKSNVNVNSMTTNVNKSEELYKDGRVSDVPTDVRFDESSPVEVISLIKTGKPKSPVKNRNLKKLDQHKNSDVVTVCDDVNGCDSDISKHFQAPCVDAHSSTDGDNSKHSSPLNHGNMRKKSAIEPELSDVYVTRTDLVRERSNAFSAPVQMKKSLSELALRNISNVAAPRSLPSQDKNSIRRSSTGNCLKNLSSWSSSFDGFSPDTSVDSDGITFQATPQDSTDSGIPIRRRTAESFGTLLQNYTPKQSASPSLNNIIEDLPTSENSPPSSNKPELDKMIGDYEVIHRFSGDFNMDSEFFETQMSFFGEIACERGLDSQNYQCKDCKRPIGLFYGKPRVCTYDGGYYCYECHENEESIIPAYIVHNWDFKKYLVSKRNNAFLIDNEDQPLLDFHELNPKIYEHIQELADVKRLRQQLCYLKAYLFTCKPSVAEDFKKSIWPREHLFDSIHVYTSADLVQVESGQLAGIVKKVLKSSISHVYSCVLCSQKGFICEICNSPKVIYPFELDSTYRCQRCKAVYHKTCKTDDTACPKCQRYIHRQEKRGSSGPSVGGNFDDFSYEPS